MTPGELGAGDEGGGDGAETDGEDTEAAVCGGNRSGLGHRGSVRRSRGSWRVPDGHTYDRRMAPAAAA